MNLTVTICAERVSMSAPSIVVILFTALIVLSGTFVPISVAQTLTTTFELDGNAVRGPLPDTLPSAPPDDWQDLRDGTFSPTLADTSGLVVDESGGLNVAFTGGGSKDIYDIPINWRWTNASILDRFDL